MKVSSRLNCNRAALLLAAILLGACGSVPVENFYALTAAAPTANSSAPAVRNNNRGPDALTILVGPITLAEMVDRPQLVVHVAANRVAILEQQRWAEPLGGEIQRVLAFNLARQLDGASVTVQPPAGGPEPQFRISLDVQRFESVLGKDVTIETAWAIRRPLDGVVTTGRTVATEAVASARYDALIAAHSRALVQVSREIADAIVRMRKPAESLPR